MTSIKEFLGTPTPLDEYESASSDFMDGGADLDKLSIFCTIADVVRKAMCDHYRESYEEDDDESGDFHLSHVIVSALVKTGLITGDTYRWADDEVVPS